MKRNIIIVGGGVVGCSVAWHLVKHDLGNITLVEKEQLGAGTTWHSAGNLTWRPDGDRDAPVLYMFDLLDEVEHESGLEIGWLRTGRLFVARHEAALASFETQAAAATARGFESHVLDPKAAARHHPLLNPEALVGAWLNGSSGHLDPSNLTAAYARAARRRGVTIVENARVEGLETKGGQVVGVRTTSGKLAADIVVVAAGLWSRELLEPLDIALAQWGCEHFYVIADIGEPLPRETPSFVAPADLIYGREDVGHFLFGCFDEGALTLDTDALPSPFAFTLLPPNWDKFAPYFETVAQLFPAVRDAPIRQFVNGPESFTPDGHPLIGRLSSFDGLYVASGMNSHGVTLSGAAGHIIADLIAEVPCRFSAEDYAPERFGEKSGDVEWLRARIADAPSGYYRGTKL